MFIYPKGMLLAGQLTRIINNEQEFASYCSNLFNKDFAQSLHKQSSADMFFDGLHYATADKRIWLEEYNGKAYIAAVFTDAEHKNGLAAYEGSSNAAMENMQPISQSKMAASREVLLISECQSLKITVSKLCRTTSAAILPKVYTLICRITVMNTYSLIRFICKTATLLRKLLILPR